MSEEANEVSGVIEEVAAPVEVEQSDSQSGQHIDPKSEPSVPLGALQAERAQRQQLQDELRVIKDHIALMQNQQQSSPPPKEKDDFEGLSDDDVMTVGEYKKLTGKYAQQVQATLSELQMAQKYPDYQQVVTKYLPDVIKQNPRLGTTLRNSQDYELAYYLARNSESYRKDHVSAQKNSDAERIIQNAQKAGSLSSTGQVSPINQAKRYKDMSDEEFRKVVNQNLGYA